MLKHVDKWITIPNSNSVSRRKAGKRCIITGGKRITCNWQPQLAGVYVQDTASVQTYVTHNKAPKEIRGLSTFVPNSQKKVVA